MMIANDGGPLIEKKNKTEMLSQKCAQRSFGNWPSTTLSFAPVIVGSHLNQDHQDLEVKKMLGKHFKRRLFSIIFCSIPAENGAGTTRFPSLFRPPFGSSGTFQPKWLPSPSPGILKNKWGWEEINNN